MEGMRVERKGVEKEVARRRRGRKRGIVSFLGGLLGLEVKKRWCGVVWWRWWSGSGLHSYVCIVD